MSGGEDDDYGFVNLVEKYSSTNKTCDCVDKMYLCDFCACAIMSYIFLI